MPFRSGLNSHQLRAASRFLTSRCRISRCRISRGRVVVHMCLVSWFLCFSFVVCQDHKLPCRWEAGLAKRTTVCCSSCCSLVARVLTKLWSAEQSAELSSPGQGSPASKPELLSVGVRMRALANLSTTVSLLLLLFDAYLPCRMAAAKALSRPRCSSGRDGGLAAVCQRRQCSLWSSGHSLWSLARWTQPLWPQPLWPQALDIAFGHSLVEHCASGELR